MRRDRVYDVTFRLPNGSEATERVARSNTRGTAITAARRALRRARGLPADAEIKLLRVAYVPRESR